MKEKGLIDACRNGNIQQVEKILNKWKKVGPLASLRRSCDINSTDQNGYTALHNAALNGHREIVGLLLGNGASPNITDSKGSSPLHLTAWAGHSDVIKLLLTFGHRGTFVNITNVDGDTPLHYATQFGHTQCCQVLLKYGADPAIRNAKRETPLELAAFYGREGTVEAMLRTHPELLAVYQNSPPSHIFSSTPLHLASRNGHKAVVDLLISSGMPLAATTSSGSALHEASLYGKVEVSKRLVELGIDIAAVNSNGETVETLLKILGTPASQQILCYIEGCGSLVQVSSGKKRDRDAPFPNPQSPASPYENILLPDKLHPKKKHNRSSSIDILLDEDSGRDGWGPPSRKLEESKIPRRHFKSVSSADSFKWSSESENSDTRPPPEGESAAFTPEHARSTQITRGTRAYSSLNYGDTKQTNGRTGDRRSLDYLPMNGTDVKRVPPKPPVKPPRKVNSSESENLNRRTTYELIYLAHSGAIDGVITNKHHPDYVDMSRLVSSCYENIGSSDRPLPVCKSGEYGGVDAMPLVHRSVDFLDDPIREQLSCSDLSFSPKLGQKPLPLPRKYVSRSYENVFDDQGSFSLPPTPDHPPPPPQLAEENIFAQLPKRQSRDIETETDMVLEISRDDSPSYEGEGSYSHINSEMDLSASVEYVEEYVTDSPFEGLVRCGLGHQLGSFADTLSLPTPSGMTQSPTRVDFGTNTESPRRTSKVLEKSLTILSPFDENEEWVKITEILGSFGGQMGRDSFLAKELQKEFRDRLGISDSCEPSTQPESEVGDWLKEVSLEKYEPLLTQSGFDDLNFIGLSVEKLKEEIEKKLPEDSQKKPFGTLGRGTIGRKKNRPPPPPIEWVDEAKNDTVASNSVVTLRPKGEEELLIRGPKELLIGFTAPVISQWKHKTSDLIRSKVHYTAEYLGTTRVLELKGTESTKRSIQKLKKKFDNTTGLTRKVTLAISHFGVSFMHPDYDETICEHAIRNIHCACQDADDLTHFAYITQDQIGSSDHFCHVFKVDTMDLATDIILTLGQAFEVAFQLALRDEKVRCHIRSKSAYEMSTPPLRGHGRTRSDNGAILTDLKATSHSDFV